MSTEIARVVIRDALFKCCVTDIKLSTINQLFQQLGVVDDFIFSTKLWVLISQSIETMWTLGDDLLDAHTVEHVNIGHCQHLEQVLVTRTPRRVSRAHFTWPQDCDVNARALEKFGH